MVLYLSLFESSDTRRSLVGVGKTAHAAHHAEHVVVDGVDAHLGRAARADRVHGHRELERGLVDTREVARAGRLVLLRLEREGVHADTRGRGRARVVLVRLHVREVATLALREAVLAVELQLGDLRRALARAASAGVEDDLGEQVVGRVLEEVGLVVAARAEVRVEPRRAVQRGALLDAQTREVRARDAIAGRRDREAGRTAAERAAGEHVHDHTLRREVVGVVERLASVDLSDVRGRRLRAVNERVALDDPDELLHRVVEVELDLVRARRDRLGTRELQLLDEVLVRLLGEAATLLRVQVDVVDVQRGSRQRLDRRRGRRRARELVVAAVDPLVELHVDAHLVVLERDQRDRQARVAAEPELERDVQRAGRGAGAGGARVGQLGAGAGDIQRVALAVLHQHEVVRVADHLIERRHRAQVLRELGPDLEPVAVLAVDALAADLKLHRLDHAVADVVQPAEAGNGRVVARAASAARAVNLDRRENHLDVRAEHQVRVTVDDGRHALVKVRLAVEGHLNGLHGEVRVALEQHLPERDLRVAADVDVLRTVADELKKTTTHIACMILSKKKAQPKKTIYRLGDPSLKCASTRSTATPVAANVSKLPQLH